MLKEIAKQVIGLLIGGLISYLEKLYKQKVLKKKFDKIRTILRRLKNKALNKKELDNDTATDLLDELDDIDSEL